MRNISLKFLTNSLADLRKLRQLSRRFLSLAVAVIIASILLTAPYTHGEREMAIRTAHRCKAGCVLVCFGVSKAQRALFMYMYEEIDSPFALAAHWRIHSDVPGAAIRY